MSDQQTLSFDRMRSMLMRAAEIRDSEQQQIFDSLDEIHARLATLDALGSMRKRLAELPDRTEVSVLAERLDETVAKLDAQDASVAAVARSVDSVVDRLAKPFAQLDGRLDGVAGRMEGIAGRMDGLDDKLAGLHKRLDDLDNRLDRHELRLDGMPGAITGPVKERLSGTESALRARLDEVDDAVRHQLEGNRDETRRNAEQTGETLRQLINETSTGLHGKLTELGQRPAIDPTDHLTNLANRLDTLGTRLDDVTKRLDSVDSTLGARPDKDSLTALVHQANHDSERRNAGQLDEAMATFAEIILGRGPGAHASQMPMPAPRPAQRRGRAKAAIKARNGTTPDEPAEDVDD
ncbi:MAG TPA: PA containing protein [Pseudonocardia sp.]|uniref:PA containing protein n=1 Tax=Pseudonocardia sp. TaxID=60912 RepID=UPI002BF8D8F9|nr:PA containing protein [Pseudonocardia sp.]HTF49189.1 PA containing protein [Pseudonocardia sp.]